MNKIIRSILLVTVLSIMIACNSKVEEGINPIEGEGAQNTSPDNSQPSVKGVENVDVLNTHGSIDGLERMQGFYEDMQKGISSDLRIVHYTIEGDPIVMDLKYNGEVIKITYDSTRDKFGSGEITTYKCRSLLEEVNPTNTSYIAIGCPDGYSGMIDILLIDYNLARQDLFELELKFGDKLENEINTKTAEFTKVINSKETRTTSDFQLSMKVKQEIYKQLITANYLGDIDLKNNCHSDESTEYFLKVYINGGQREFHWSSCDQSLKGAKFTEIAEYIIMQFEIKQLENPETVIQGYILQIKDDALLIGVDLNLMDYE